MLKQAGSSMKIDYISDTHFDAYLDSTKNIKDHLHKIFLPFFEDKQSDTLIIAGDIGECNFQNLEALRYLRDEVGYKHILIVLGNHDWYLSNPESREKYNNKSINRVNEFKEMIAQADGLHLLDGNVIEINGVKIGGCMSWYDGKYMFHNLNNHNTKNKNYLQRLWQEYNPDNDMILGCLETYDEFCKEEFKKLKRIYQKCDVLVTHINPSIKVAHTAHRWKAEDTSAFFTFDGSVFLADTTVKYWLFGHSHDKKDFLVGNVECRSNPLGNPNEFNKNFRVKHIEI